MTLPTPEPVVRALMFDLLGNFVYCQFNPESLQRSKSARWTTAPTRGAVADPRPQFVGPGRETLRATLMFDMQSGFGHPMTATVQMATDQLLKWLTVPEVNQLRSTPQPSPVTFQWGIGLTFVGVLRSVTVNYTLFAPSGNALRATADIEIQATPNDPLGTNPTSGGVLGHTSAQVQEGDTLASIAYRQYGDANLWRAIAHANDIEDPARIPIGTRLLVPPFSTARELSMPTERQAGERR